MFATVSDSKQVAKIQKAFEKALMAEGYEVRFVSLGHQGSDGSFDSKIYYFPRLSF